MLTRRGGDVGGGESAAGVALGILALALALGGCTSPLPAWVTENAHPSYPSAEYLLAVGTGSGKSAGENQEQADTTARRNLILSLRTRVQTLIESRSELRVDLTGAGGAGGRVTATMQDLTHVVGEGMLEGAAIAFRHVDAETGTVWSLAALHRASSARAMAARIEGLLRDVEGELARVAALPRVRHLVPLATAYKLSEEARVVRATREVLVGGPVAPLARDRNVEIRSQLASLLGDLRLEVVAGQDQQGDIGAALREEVVLRLELQQETGRAGVPQATLRLTPEHPEAIKLSAEELVTGESGGARFQVAHVGHTGAAGNAIHVALDILGLEGFTPPAVDVRYSLPTRETLRILVLVEESNLGEVQTPSSVAVNVGRAIRDARFALVDPGLVVEGVRARSLFAAEPAELRRILGDRVDVVVRGKASTEVGGVMLGLPAVRATAKLEGVYLRSGQVIISVEKTAPEAHNDRRAAGQRALRALANELSKPVVAGLEKLLSAPPPGGGADKH